MNFHIDSLKNINHWPFDLSTSFAGCPLLNCIVVPRCRSHRQVFLTNNLTEELRKNGVQLTNQQLEDCLPYIQQ